jgi:putative adenylate-forming enzyme
MNLPEKLWTVYRLNNQFYKWDRQTLTRHQQKRINHILSYASSRAPYYHRILGDRKILSLSDLPVIDKMEMMQHFDEINTAGLNKNALIEFQLKQEKAGTLNLYHGFSVGVSSGTSGNKGLTVLSANERELYSCLLFARNGIPKSVKQRRILFALRTNNPAFMQVEAFGITIIHVDYTHPVEYLIGIINEKRLNIIAGPPSLLVMLAAQRKLIDHRIDTVISYAEVLPVETKKRLEADFGVPVVQIYQGSEGFIASTCKNGNLHLNEDTIFVEPEKTADTIGNASNIIVTDLYRTTQPIIQYRLNDILEISTVPCDCGSSFRVVERIHGRADDVFYLKGQDGKTKCLFPDYVQKSIIHASDEIIEYQAIQHSLELIEIRLVLKENADRTSIENKIRNNLNGWAEKAGGMTGEITFSQALPERNIRSQKLIRVVRQFQL